MGVLGRRGFCALLPTPNAAATDALSGKSVKSGKGGEGGKGWKKEVKGWKGGNGAKGWGRDIQTHHPLAVIALACLQRKGFDTPALVKVECAKICVL